MNTKPTHKSPIAPSRSLAAMPCYPSFGEVLNDKDGLWYKYDFDSCDSRDQWEEWIDVMEMLAAIGWRLIEPIVEHDCISGGLGEIPADNSQTHRHESGV